MAASTFEQTWNVYRYSDGEIVLTGPNATGWTLQFEIGTDPTAVPLLTITPTISTVTVTVPLTKAQLTTTLTAREYFGVLWRMDSGSRKPLASGRLLLPILLHPIT